jgi:hypothetical protein
VPVVLPLAVTGSHEVSGGRGGEGGRRPGEAKMVGEMLCCDCGIGERGAARLGFGGWFRLYIWSGQLGYGPRAGSSCHLGPICLVLLVLVLGQKLML